MTPERARELLPIIQAFSEGKRIEWFESVANTWHYTNDPLLSDDIQYRIAPEPKKKVKMWLAAYTSSTSAKTIITNCFYRSEDEARNELKKFICLAPWSEIEVDVDDE